MAVLLSKAMGCRVTAISRTEEKKDDALALGADSFIVSSTDDVTKKTPDGQGIDILLITSNSVPSIRAMLPLLARRATIVLMTIQQESLEIPYLDFVLPGHRLIGSTDANKKNYKKMLEFVEEKGIVPWIEEFEMNEEGIGRAFQRLETGNMRFRGVIRWEKEE